MLWLLALSLLSAATLGSVLAYQRGMADRLGPGERRRALPPREEPAVERTPQTLTVGDVVIEGDDDWLIVGTATYREEDERWWVHVLDDGMNQRRMEVRRKVEWRVTLLEPTTEIPEFGQLGQGLTFRQQPYALEGRGDARVTWAGQGDTPSGLLRYATYLGPGGSLLNIEERDGTRRSWAGVVIEASGLMLMPGRAPDADDDHSEFE